MCKYCEMENQEYLEQNDGYDFWIRNPIGGLPYLICRTEKDLCKMRISYCPVCGSRLVNYEDLQSYC